jgi:hypothetical protein
MTIKRLTIADLQIYFKDDGAALFDARGKQRAAIEMELAEYRDFIDRWLEASEEPRPRMITSEERGCRTKLKAIVRAFRRDYDRTFIEAAIRAAVKHNNCSALTAEQIEESIANAISTL